MRVSVSVCACAYRGRGRAETSCNFPLQFSNAGGERGRPFPGGVVRVRARLSRRRSLGRCSPAGRSGGNPVGGGSSLRAPAGNGAGPGRRSFCRSLAHPLAQHAASQHLCHVGESLYRVALCFEIFLFCFVGYFFLILSRLYLILLGFLCVLLVFCARPYPFPRLPDESASPSLLLSKCVSDSNHRAVIPRQLPSSEGRGGPQLGRVPEGHPAVQGIVRPLPRGPAELHGAKAAMPPVPTSSRGSGTPGESAQPRGTELGCVLASPQSASPAPSPAAGAALLRARAGMWPRSRTGGRCPREREGRPGLPRAPPPRVLGDPIISAAVRADDVMWALFFFFFPPRKS